MPEGAIDYRNNASELLNPLWMRLEDVRFSSPVERYAGGKVLDAKGQIRTDPRNTNGHPYQAEDGKGRTKSDLNDRGRGRTVETQSGGVAVLRAWWELLHAI